MLGFGRSNYLHGTRWRWTLASRRGAGQRSQRLALPEEERVTDHQLRCVSFPVRGGDTSRPWRAPWDRWPSGRPSGWAPSFRAPTWRSPLPWRSRRRAWIFEFRRSDDTLALKGTRWHDFHRASVCPAHGSQPGAQAGRHALEGRKFDGWADCADRSPNFELDTVAIGPVRSWVISCQGRRHFWRLVTRKRARSLPILPRVYTRLRI
jgi:hypothetical protein